MKKVLVSLALVFSLGIVTSCGESDSSSNEVEVLKVEKKEVLAENKAVVDMKVEGMVCAQGCAKFIEDKVAELDGVVLSSVNFASGEARFEFDKTITNSADIEKFIDEMHDGQYKAEIIDLNKPVENIEVKSESQKTEAKKEVASVVERFQISIPELFSYFLHSLR